MDVRELVAGTLIGARYRLERQLGEGGMGVVWAAEDVTTHQHHALKFMKDAAGDPDARRRFLREGRAASAVRHPNVVSILEVLEPEDGSPVIVMELLEGESLRDLLEREQRIALAPLADILVPVISAVGTAHALGVVHRDLKPENIFLARGAGGERVVKVLDFGIAKVTALDGEAMRSTGVTTGAVLGTPAFMAPEQVFGEKDLDHRADVWALGIIVYQCLSGVLPTHGENVGQVLKHVLARPFEPLDQLVPDLPQDLSRLVTRMLARDRSHRPSDLREVLERLEPFASTPGVRFGAPAAAPLHRTGAPTVMLPIAPRNRARVGKVDLPTTTRDPGPRPRRARPRAVLGSAVAIVLLGMGVAGWRRARSSVPGPTIVRSPLDAPDAKIACPILDASGVDEPTGWLGAAAAATVCERARVILGGRPERTLVPAELLGLPRRLVDGFQAEPYAPQEARQRSVVAARTHANAYIDGKVEKKPLGFGVTLELRSADARLMKISEGSGRGLYEAVREAMTPLVRSGLLPMAHELDPVIAKWSRTRDIGAALGLLDLTFAIAHNAGGLKEECERFERMSRAVGELGPAARWLCAYTLGLPEPRVDLDESDRSPEAIATRIRIQHFVHHADAPGDADRLHTWFESDRTSWGRSLLAATESCLLQSYDSKRAAELAITAVEAEPKNPDGQVCDPWGQLVMVTQGSGAAESATRAMQAWAPWNDIGWLMQGLAAANPNDALLPLRRAYELTPYDTLVANTLANKLLAAGKRESARGIAREVRSGGYPVHQLASEIIFLRIDASEARFGAAFARAWKASEISSTDAGWVRAQRFEAAWRALELANILGNAPKVAEDLVQRFLDPQPPPLDGSDLPLPARIAAVCALASPARSPGCFDRFRALRGHLSGGITPDIDDFMTGAERYAKRDLAGAARAWRPLLRGDRTLVSVLPDAMADAFERNGDLELAEQVDDAVMVRAGELNGATLGHVRAARRAFARSDRVKARALANDVINAWHNADEAVPAVVEMRQLLARLPER